MHRKAAFFKRIAAMQCVSPTNPKPAWVKCYQLLLQALEGYRLSLDPTHNQNDTDSGWSVVQLRVMQELVYSARRMSHAPIATRHLMHLLHSLFNQLTIDERKEMATVLETQAAKIGDNGSGTTQILSLENGIMLPPIPFIYFPTVRLFKLVNPPPHLRPVKLKKLGLSSDSSDNPFIYSPIQFGVRKQTDGSVMDFKWVQGDVCEVELQVHNPLPFELKVSDIGLLTEGISFESYPASLTLPSESGPFQVTVTGVAKESGQLNILGYHTLVLGCCSNCCLSDMPQIAESQYDITVVPPLPLLGITTSLPKASSFSSMEDSDSVVTSAQACVYAGQSCECTINLTNQGKVPIEVLSVEVDSKLNKEFLGQVLEWNEENVQSQLPLSPGAQACFTAYIHGVSTFLAPDKIQIPDTSGGLSRSASSASGGQWASAVAEVTSSDPSGALVLDILLRLQYSGGEGLKEKYCRHCCVSINIEIQPAVLINRWDIIPAESVHHSNLILDFENACSEELNLQYSKDSSVTLSQKQCQRIALEIPKCNPHSQLRDSEDSLADIVSQHINNLVDIRWTIPSSNAEGKVSLESLELNHCNPELLTVSPVQWEVHINEELVTENSTHAVLEGQHAIVNCALTNNAESAITHSDLMIQCYQDCGSGLRKVVTGEKVIRLGTSVKKIHKINSSSSEHHSCAFLFITSGRYILELSATGHLQTSHYSLAPTPSSQLEASKQMLSSASSCSSTDQSASVIERWTHIPCIILDVKKASCL